LFIGLSSAFAQEYLPPSQAVDVLTVEYKTVVEYINDWTGEKTMDYYKAVSKKQLLSEMILGFKQGLTTEEVEKVSDSTMSKDKFQKVKPMFPDSNGKVGTNWINEELLILLYKD